jgi:hypothetical protein
MEGEKLGLTVQQSDGCVVVTRCRILNFLTAKRQLELYERRLIVTWCRILNFLTEKRQLELSVRCTYYRYLVSYMYF